jgi:transcription antitermination protein NusB
VSISASAAFAHGFYGEDEPGLVNAVLDTVAREVRPGELEKAAGSGRPRGGG